LRSESYQQNFADGQMSVQNLNDGGYQIEIENPNSVALGLVNSGQIKFSSQLDDSGLWQLISKFARIRLRVADHLLKGVVELN